MVLEAAAARAWPRQRQWYEAVAAVARGCSGGGTRLQRRWHESVAAVARSCSGGGTRLQLAAAARGCSGGGTRLRRRWHEAATAAHRHRSRAAKLPSCQHEPQRWGATPKTLPPKEIIAADEKGSA